MAYYVDYGIRIKGKKDACDSIYNSIDNIEGESENIYTNDFLTAYGTTRGEIDRELLKEKTALFKTNLEYFEHGEDYGDIVEYYAIENGEVKNHYSIELNEECDISYELDDYDDFCNLKFKNNFVKNNKSNQEKSKYDDYDSDKKNYKTSKVEYVDGTIGEMLEKYKGSSNSIIIPEGITCISNNLPNCGKLKRIIMPKSLRCLPDDMLYKYKDLEYLEISDPHIEYMDDYGYIPRVRSNTKLTKDDFVIVGQALFFYIGNQKEVIIPEGIVAIHPYAFANNEIVRTIKMPNSVTHIMECAFWYCSNLENVVFSKCIEKIDNQAFVGCKKLTQVEIPKETKLGSNAFENCYALADNDFIIINDYLIQYLGSDKIVNIPDGVRVIGESAFETNDSIIKVNMPDSIEIIGNSAFTYCENLKEVVASRNIKKIGQQAFYNCKELEIMNLNNFDNIEIETNQFFSTFGNTKLSKYIEKLEERK